MKVNVDVELPLSLLMRAALAARLIPERHSLGSLATGYQAELS